MQRKVRTAIVMIIIFITFLVITMMHLTEKVYASPTIKTLVKIASHSITTNSTGSGPTGVFDSTLIAAFIGLGGVILGLLVAIFTSIFQTRHNDRFQRELAAKNEQLQRELVRTQKRLEHEYQLREHQEKQENVIATAEAKRQRMLQAPTDEDRVKLYREALQDDPHIAALQILEMKRPLAIANVYVRMRVHHEKHENYGIDPTQYAISVGDDPNEILQMERNEQEKNIKMSITPEMAISQYTHCAILGDPGAGKSTLLKYLAITAAKEELDGLNSLLPIYIELNAFANSGFDDLLDFIAVYWDSLYAFPYEYARIYIANQLDEGKALLLLDALDETVVGETTEAAERAYTKVSQLILQLATRYRKAPILVTVRRAGYRQHAPLVGFAELDVLDFRPEDIQKFISNWYASSQNPHWIAKRDDLIQRLERNPRLQTLATNPLLLTLIVLVYEAQLDLPDRRAELYKRCVEVLLTEWDARRNIRRRRDFKPEHKRQLLEVVAWHFHKRRQRYFPERELLNVIASFLPAIGLPPEQNSRILEEIASEQGLLKEQAHGWHGFLHLTLQEYFAAQYVTDHNQLETLLMYRGDPWWEEVMLLYAGHVPDASLLLQSLLGECNEENSKLALKEDIFYSNIMLAGRCLATRPTVWQASLRQEVISRLFQALLSTSYSLTRKHMAEILAEIGGTEVNIRFIQLLSDDKLNTDIRGSIASALGELGERTIAQDLIRLLSDDKLNTDIRGSIASALGELGERTIAQDLVRLLSDDKLDTDIRRSIVSALGELGERTIAQDLVRLLSDDKLDTRIRRSIASALGELGERTIAQDLVRLLSDDKLDAEIRWGIASALGELGERAIAQDLVRLLSDDKLDTQVRVSIASALEKLGERAIAQDLVRLLSDDKLDTNIRGSIASALGELGERAIAQDLVRLLSDSKLDIDTQVDASVKGGGMGFGGYMSMHIGIACALAVIEERSIVPDLIRLISDDKLSCNTYGGIIYALVMLGEHSLLPDLIKLLYEEKLASVFRWFMTSAFNKIGERTIAQDLVRLLSDDKLDAEIRGSIASALGELGEHTIAQDLVRLLSDDKLDAEIRGSIASALGQLGERVAAQDLVRLLSDDKLGTRIRVSIASALGKLGERAAAQDLVRLLSDNKLDTRIREAIVSALGVLINDEGNVRALILHLDELDLSNHIYTTLWNVSRRLGIRILASINSENSQIEVVKWGKLA